MKNNRLYGWLILSFGVAVMAITIAVLWQHKAEPEQPVQQGEAVSASVSSHHNIVVNRQPDSERNVSEQASQSAGLPSEKIDHQTPSPPSSVSSLAAPSVVANKADESSVGKKPATTPPDPWLEGAVEIERRDIPLPEENKLRRIRVLKTNMKYPLVRVEEDVQIVPGTGEERVVKRVGMSADHVIVKLKPGMTEAQLQAIINKYGGKIRAHKKLSGIYLIETPDVTVDSVPRAIENYKKEIDAIAYAEPDYIVSAQEISRFSPNILQFKPAGISSKSGQ